MESDRHFSLYVSRALDCLGKSQGIAKFRIEYYTEVERYNNICAPFTRIMVAGSKGEGLTAPLESDLDSMCINYSIICAENTAPFSSLPVPCMVFHADRRNTSPGYTKLRLEHVCGLRPFLPRFEDPVFVNVSGQLYYSSESLVDIMVKYLPSIGKQTRSGPSLSSCHVWGQDFVISHPCDCPQITQSFIERRRDYGWPSYDQLTKISSLEGHVVPVGYKGSHTAFLEWRICYTKAERFLMRSLNDTQKKIYVLLKMVAKTYLNLVCNEITSYVLKNIVLWQAERGNLKTFTKDLIVDKLIQALQYLRQCIINNNLPNYMIPERNMFAEKLDLVQRQKLVSLLTGLIHEGGGLLMGCERLRGTMAVLYKEPAIAEHYGRKRDMIEKLWMCQCHIAYDRRRAFSDAANINIIIKLVDLIFKDRFCLIRQGHDTLTMLFIFWERYMMWLS